MNCILRSKIVSARSLMNLKIYKTTQETLAQKSSFDRMGASVIIYN